MLRYVLIGVGAFLASPTFAAETPVFTGAECVALTYLEGGTRWVTANGKLQNTHPTEDMYVVCPIKIVAPLAGTTDAVVVVIDQNDAKSVSCTQVVSNFPISAQYSDNEETGNATVGNFLELDFPSMGYGDLFDARWFECEIPDVDIDESSIDSYRIVQ
jgi:hypothetical protein